MNFSPARTATIALAALTTFAPSLATAASLTPLPTAVESFDVGTLHVDHYGTGTRPIVLVPGLGCGPWVWGGTIAHLARANAVYVLTLPGFDGRPATTETSLFGAFDRDLSRLIAERKLGRPAIVGHSLGGTLAFAFAEYAPGTASSIVAVDGLPIFPTLAFAPPAARTAAADAAASAVAKQTTAEELAYDQKFMASVGTVDAQLVDPVATLEAKSDPAAVAAWLREDLATDLRPDLAKIASPVLEVMPYNAPDRTTPPLNFTQEQTLGFYQTLLTGTPHLTVSPVANARHFVMLDQPTAFYAVLDRFLAQANPR